MTDQPGAAPADTSEPAAGTDAEPTDQTTDEDREAQRLLADAVASDPDAEHLSDPGKRALDRMNREAKAAKEQLAEAQQKLKEFEDRDKTDLQKANERAAELEQTATKAQAEALRYRIAARNEISDEDAETFLTGTDEDALNRQAERLVALRGEQSAPRVPRPDPSQGSRGPVDLDAQIAEAEKKGDVRASIRLKQEKAAATRAAAHTR